MNKKSQEKKRIIGIDARFYGPRQKGLGRYVQKLVDNLEKVDSSNQYIIFLRKENWSEYQPKNPNFKKVLANYPWYGFKEQFLMPFKIWQQKIDLMHFTHFNLPVFCFSPFVVTIHDLVLRRFPTRRASKLSPIGYWLKNLAYRIVISSAISRSKKIITVSNYTKGDILEYFKVDPDKIEVIYEGRPDKSVKDTTVKSNIAKPYLLYVGNAYPHKNLERLIFAFKKLVNDHQMSLRLVLVGEMDYFYKRLKDTCPRALLDKIIFTDFLPDDDLNTLYQNASVYVFPSLYEGFGLPPLEAMSHDLPVVSSKAACLPEILGQAAIYFNPENIEEMADQIKKVLVDEKVRQKLVSLGQQRIKEYNWTKAALQTLELYRAVD